MQGCNGFTIEHFTDKEIDELLVGLQVNDEFTWRGEICKVTSINPFKCHCLWDLY